MAKETKETPEEAERIAREGTPEARKKLKLIELLASPEYRDRLTRMKVDKELGLRGGRQLQKKAKQRLPSSAEEAGVPRGSIGGSH